MAKYTGKQSVLDTALGSYINDGFSLTEPDDHLLELWFKDKRIAVYNQTKATIPIIREGCKNFLANFLANKLAQEHYAIYSEELKHND